jgi:hypothetical protein
VPILKGLPSGVLPSAAADVGDPLLVVHPDHDKMIHPVEENTANVVFKVDGLQMKVHVAVTGVGKNHNYGYDGYFDEKEIG